MTVTLSDAPDANVGADPSKHPLLRRWDHKEGDPTGEGLQLAGDGAALIIEGSDEDWLSLEDGVYIQFPVGPPASTHRTGDYWLIPARTATADVEWPREPAKDSRGNPVIIPVALPPAGVQHHYAPPSRGDADQRNHHTAPDRVSQEVQHSGRADAPMTRPAAGWAAGGEARRRPTRHRGASNADAVDGERDFPGHRDQLCVARQAGYRFIARPSRTSPTHRSAGIRGRRTRSTMP
jgi:Family of unknown function (DUF6519)